MKFLLDTNIFIPLEPTNASDIEPQTSVAAAFLKKAVEAQQQLYLHPESIRDIERDKNDERKDLRRSLFEKYPTIPNPPPITENINSVLGESEEGSNDWVDLNLLAAIEADAVDYLVTEDQRLYKRCVRIGLSTRVLDLQEALSVLNGLFDEIPPPPPAVKNIKAHQLNNSDPIFISLRSDYPGFDNWLSKCKLGHRDAWVIHAHDRSYAGIAIVKREKPPEYGLAGKVLKICTLKVSSRHNGFHFGELLLKSILRYAHINSYDNIYVTSFDKHLQLINLIHDFGFEPIDAHTPLGEKVFVKRLTYNSDDLETLSPLSFQIKFGPYALSLNDIPTFIVPIWPQYHRVLFPDLEDSDPLFPGMYPSGNSIRKAYISSSKIRKISPGSLLFFYRTRDLRQVTCVGVVEDTFVSGKASHIARYVGKRTVYSYDEISSLCDKNKEMLSILFRQSFNYEKPIGLEKLMDIGALKGPPQSITETTPKASEWLVNQIQK